MNGRLRTLLIDDEQAARVRLRRMLQAREYLDIIGEARDGLEAAQMIESERPGLVFLDIQMPGLDGFEVLRAVSAPLPLVIFVTGYDEHALRAFQAQALAYLLKPIEQEMLDAMVERAWSLYRYGELQNGEEVQVRRALEAAPAKLERIVARRANHMLLLDPSEICFFSTESGIVRVNTSTQSYWVNYTMGELEAALAPRRFFRAHRSTLINLDQVREIRPDARSSFQLVMNDGARTLVDVSERQGKVLRTLIPGI
jgi:two-component system, LytTR family, response regulator